MSYLLDVSALVAFGFFRHTSHQRVARWVRTLESDGIPELATCPITELGFVRVLAQTSEYGLTVTDGRSLLQRLKTGTTPKFTFLADNHDISQLPGWVTTGGQTTDGHLLQLAQANGHVFATLDEKIPGAFLIPA